MKVKILATGSVEEYDPGYATRLIDMGYAVPEPEEAAEEPKTDRIPDPEPAPEPAPDPEPTPDPDSPKGPKPAKSRKAR